MKAMELSLAMQIQMSYSRVVSTSLGAVMVRYSSWSLVRRRTMRRHGTKRRVSGMIQMPELRRGRQQHQETLAREDGKRRGGASSPENCRQIE
jgi:aminoglycoside N3'-acetyltransferase